MHLNDVVNILNYKLHNICRIIFKLQVHDNPYIKMKRFSEKPIVTFTNSTEIRLDFYIYIYI